MTFDAAETSAALGRPVELYSFTGPTAVAYLTPYDEDVSNGGLVYESTPGLSRSDAPKVQVGQARELTVTLPVDHALCRTLRLGGLGPRGVELVISRLHTTDSSATLREKWRGDVLSLECDEQYARLRVASLVEDRLQVSLPMAVAQPLCNHQYGDAGCVPVEESGGSGLVFIAGPAIQQFITNVATVSGTAITINSINGKPDGWANRGAIIRASDGEPRTIMSQTGTSLVIDVPFGTLNPGDAVTIRAGCDKKVETCANKFDNVDNFSGDPVLPERNVTAPTGYGVSVQE